MGLACNVLTGCDKMNANLAAEFYYNQCGAYNQQVDIYMSVKEKIIRQQARGQVHTLRRYLSYLRLAQKNIRQVKVKDALARQFRKKQQLKIQRQVFVNIQRVLSSEVKWQQSVRYEFELTKQEGILQDWKLFVKYQQLKRLKRYTLYQKFHIFKFLSNLTQFKKEADLRRSQLCNLAKQQKLHKLLSAFKQNALKQQRAKYLHHIEQHFRTNRLLHICYSAMAVHYREMKRIKGDVFLRRALIDGEDFFTLDIGSQSGVTDTMICGGQMSERSVKSEIHKNESFFWKLSELRYNH